MPHRLYTPTRPFRAPFGSMCGSALSVVTELNRAQGDMRVLKFSCSNHSWEFSLKMRTPNSICKKCGSPSMKFSNDTCLANRGNGSRCEATLYGILDGELSKCSHCEGNGRAEGSKCEVCQGYGQEYQPRK